MDSRLRGNDGRFCKGLIDRRGQKPIPAPDTGAEGENDAPHRHVIADLIRNPEVKGGAYNKTTPTESPLP